MNMIDGLQDHVEDHLSLLTPIEQAWQPTDYLPDLTAEDWSEQLGRFRETVRRLPDELLIVLVGNMVTEEALPNYAISLEHVVKDPTGTTDTPWARWLRGWTAEENRHGDLLNAYLRLTGRVDMRAVERTIQHLIRNGFSPGNEGDDYAGLIYAAFQERAHPDQPRKPRQARPRARRGESGAGLPQDRGRRDPPRGLLHQGRGRVVRARSGSNALRLPGHAQAAHRDARQPDDGWG